MYTLVECLRHMLVDSGPRCIAFQTDLATGHFKQQEIKCSRKGFQDEHCAMFASFWLSYGFQKGSQSIPGNASLLITNSRRKLPVDLDLGLMSVRMSSPLRDQL